MKAEGNDGAGTSDRVPLRRRAPRPTLLLAGRPALREDVPEPSLSQQDTLANCADARGGFIVVPRAVTP